MRGLEGHDEEFGLYFMGVEQVVANDVHKILDHIYSISKAKWSIDILTVVIICIEHDFHFIETISLVSPFRIQAQIHSLPLDYTVPPPARKSTR